LQRFQHNHTHKPAHWVPFTNSLL